MDEIKPQKGRYRRYDGQMRVTVDTHHQSVSLRIMQPDGQHELAVLIVPGDNSGAGSPDMTTEEVLEPKIRPELGERYE